MPSGFYIHIPFCLSKCPYCDFYSIPYTEELAQKFVNALKKDILLSSKIQPWAETVFSTLYIGGGTPTVLTHNQLEEILLQCLRILTFRENSEITVEANPETINEEKLGTLMDLGVNRLSLGLQSLDDNALKGLCRIHSVTTAINAFQTARRVGIRNIGVDLIFAIPGQSLESWKDTLQQTVKLGPEHISTYNLTIEPGTAFAKDLDNGKLSSFSEDQEAIMYEYAIDFLESQGYEHYEISNFALPGYYSKHNKLYWDHNPYLGLGPSAHSFFKSYRSERVRDVHDYIRRIDHGESPIEKEETLSHAKLMAEAIFLALRKRDGLNTDLFRQQFDIEIDDLYNEAIKKYTDLEMLERKGSFLRFTHKGLMVANTICAEFMQE